MTDGLVPPLNAPPAAPLVPGIQPGALAAVIRAVLALIGGGPPGSISGVFVYDPAIAAGDLIASMTDSLTDPFGDTTVKGVAAYVTAGGRLYAVGLNTSGPGGLPGVTVQNVASFPTTPAGFYAESSAAGTIAEASVYSGQSTAGDVAAQIIVLSQLGSGGVTGGLVQMPAGRVTLGNAPTVTVNDTTGAVTATRGSAATPTLLTTDVWNSLAIGGSWTAAGTGVNGFFYRLLTTGDVLLAWEVNNNSATPGTLGTLPAGYRPAGTVRLQSGWTGTGPTTYNDQFAPALQITSAGVITGVGLFVGTLTMFGTAILPIGAL